MNKQEFWQNKQVLVTGASGFVGQNLLPLLSATGCQLFAPSRTECNLLEQQQVRNLMKETSPDVVFHLAGLSGGIMANKQYPANFCYQNLLMNTLVMHEAFCSGVEKYITLIGGCSYPANAPSPIAEESLWNGYPQPESAPYSVAKKMNVTMAEAYRTQHGFDAIVLVPGNIYGPFDNFDLQNAHVIPALLRKFYEAQVVGSEEVIVWGTGRAVRDFVYVGDVCEAIVIAAEMYSSSDIINISMGKQVTIRELVESIAAVTGYEGRIQWDKTKPDGQMYKGFDVTRLHQRLGFHGQTSLATGLQKTLTWFIENYETARLDVPVQPEWRNQAA